MQRILSTVLVAILAAAAAAAAEDRPDYSLTIYSSAVPGQIGVDSLANYGRELPGYALVRDGRRINLEKGIAELRFTDVARRIDPTTVSFASLTDPGGTRVVEQNYQFDLVSQQKLVERFLGSTVTVEQATGDRIESVTGRLLSADGGLILARESGEVVTLAAYSNVRFPSLPGGLITRPTLVWKIDTRKGGAHDARVSYQTRGMTWWSDYNVTLRENGERCDMDLSAWVTIVNQAGASFAATQLRLVAGEVNRAPTTTDQVARSRMELSAAKEGDVAGGFQESQLFEYHLYTLGRRTDLPDNSTKQMELFPTATAVKCRKQLVFTAAPLPWPYWSAPISDQGYAATSEGTTGAYLEFENKEANSLGVPLPAGRVRVNQAATDGSLEFIGEDLIKHTPRSETVRVKLGNSFDIVGERKQTAFTYNEQAEYIDETFEVSVRNRKQTAERVIAREYLYRWSNWEIANKDHAFEKRDAQTIDFPLDIPADSEAKVTYTVRYSW